MTVLFLLATLEAIAQVVAHEETNLVTLVKSVTLTVLGDKSYSPQGSRLSSEFVVRKVRRA
jgi:hypothetical protein